MKSPEHQKESGTEGVESFDSSKGGEGDSFGDCALEELALFGATLPLWVLMMVGKQEGIVEIGRLFINTKGLGAHSIQFVSRRGGTCFCGWRCSSKSARRTAHRSP